MKTFASLFSGGGLADIGAIQAGLKPLWGVEFEAKIAEWYARNIDDHVLVARVQDVDYGSLETPYWLHMSPPCTNASVANSAGGETELDIEMAQGCIAAIQALRPPMVSLENVFAYRHFESFKRICRALEDEGYKVKWWHLNAANAGVPQTRKRLFLVASRIKAPQRPMPTHQKRSKIAEQQLSFFPMLLWNGWYAAIEDLLDTLPDDEFAPWQLPLLPKELQTMLIAQGKYDRNLVMAKASSPAFTVTSNGNQTGLRGFLASSTNASNGLGLREERDPAMTISARMAEKGVEPRAFLVNTDSKSSSRCASLPAMTIVSSREGMRAFNVDGQTNDSGESMTIRDCEERFLTVSASQEKRAIRAYASGRVVRMTPRCLARFQSVPDSYVLPEKASLACHIIGNGVPSLLMQRLIEANL